MSIQNILYKYNHDTVLRTELCAPKIYMLKL